MATQLEREAECAAVVTAFAYYVDRQMYREVADLFAEDGSFGRPGMSIQGRTNLYDTMAKRPPTTVTLHVCTAPVFLSSSDTEAEAITYYTMYQSTAVETGVPECEMPPVLGEYRDRFVRTSEGWRIASREVSPKMTLKAAA